jgi:hypothetical protein
VASQRFEPVSPPETAVGFVASEVGNAWSWGLITPTPVRRFLPELIDLIACDRHPHAMPVLVLRRTAGPASWNDTARARYRQSGLKRRSTRLSPHLGFGL